MSIPDPCKKICKVDPITGLCIGCYRSIYERNEHWHKLNDGEKRLTLKLTELRMGRFGVFK